MDDRESYLISDKFTPQCANGQPTAMADMIDMQLRLMSLDRFDIYWIHNVWDAPHWTEELAKYYEGRDDVPLLGVSNHNLSEIKQANDILKEIPHNTAAHLAVPFPTSAACRFLDLPPGSADPFSLKTVHWTVFRALEPSKPSKSAIASVEKFTRQLTTLIARYFLKAHGLRLSAVQNHLSLINRSSEASGILDYCRENDIHFFAYMVLEQGALSGKYDTRHPMPEGSARAETYNPVLDKLEVLNAELKRLADKYGVGPAQIPVAWAIAKGTLPIIGVTKVSHVEDAVKAANVTLTDEETKGLEALADSLGINAIRFWEKEMK